MSETPLAPLERHNVPAAQTNYQPEIADADRYYSRSEVAVSDTEHLNLFVEETPRAEVFDQMNADHSVFAVPGETVAAPRSRADELAESFEHQTSLQLTRHIGAVSRALESIRTMAA